MGDAYDHNSHFVPVDCVKQSIITDTTAIEVGELAIQTLDIRSIVGIFTEQRVYEIMDLFIDSTQTGGFADLLSKSGRLFYAKRPFI